ncbi:hypothetical protein [Mucilaginibacter pocheonensis]|uniref:Uncharacterized protein n=1 Tax=Mucilaginibacter pocheonensis TaxID=398050 RepID=A0ABU1T648_9SPHI|nr:hypothetical protein [Mucilaginibacter pocheonensis]MDR6940870.1 hypothetical protein [Mucilaginibacter pocheonensis]
MLHSVQHDKENVKKGDVKHKSVVILSDSEGSSSPCCAPAFLLKKMLHSVQHDKENVKKGCKT